MNIYSFKRISSGASKGFYFHPFFQRSDISLAHKILRKKQKSELSSSTLLTFQEGSCDEISPSSFTSFVVDSPVIKDDNIDPRPIQFLAPTAAIDTPLSTTPNFQDEKMHGTGISFCDDSSCEQKGASFSRDRYSLSYASAIGRNDLKSGQNMNFVVSPACYLTMFAKYNWGCIMHGAQLAKEGGELDENDNDSVATIDDLSYLM